jgi:putative ABC transport system permease protein
VISILVNETAAKIFGFANPTDIVGREMDGAGFHCKVIGVVKDYHQEIIAIRL